MSAKKTDKSTKSKASSGKTQRSLPKTKAKATATTAKVRKAASGRTIAAKPASKKVVSSKTKAAARPRSAASRSRTVSAGAAARSTARTTKAARKSTAKSAGVRKAAVKSASRTLKKTPTAKSAATRPSAKLLKAKTLKAKTLKTKTLKAGTLEDKAVKTKNLKATAVKAKPGLKARSAPEVKTKLAVKPSKAEAEKKAVKAVKKTASKPEAVAVAKPVVQAKATESKSSDPRSPEAKVSQLKTPVPTVGEPQILERKSLDRTLSKEIESKRVEPKTSGQVEAAQALDIEIKLSEAEVTIDPDVSLSSESPAEPVAVAFKKAAEKIMIGKAAKTTTTLQAGTKAVPAPKLDVATPVAAKAPERKNEKVAVKPPAQKPASAPAPRHGFKVMEFIVYPAHGVGEIVAVEEQEVAGFRLELFVISFIKDKMILKVPVTKAASVGMRKLAESGVVKKALDTLTGRARVKRTMWSRRAQEYEAKINSGDLVAIAEVVRDLYRSDAQPEQSYSERQLYEAALDRLSREIGTVQKLTETESLKVIETQLQKGPRRSKAEEADAEGDSEDGEIEEAA